MNLRPYQKECLEKIRWEREKNLEGNSLVILPTGAGKSIIISELAKELNEDILILQPSKEILEQNLDKLLRYIDRSEIGIYSASMDEKVIKKYTLATIQSIYRHAEFFKHFKTVLIDEAHLVNPKNLDGMFTSFLREIGNPKVIGLTATPYRMDSLSIKIGKDYWMRKTVTTIKLINRMKGHFWKRILFNINVEDLMEQGYLCPLEYIDNSIVDHHKIPLNKSGSDFNIEAYENMISSKKEDILKSISYGKSIAKSVLVFCSSVEQANSLAELTIGSEVVTSETPDKKRSEIINGFKDGSIQVVFNVGVLTTGFDHPGLDCVILLRPTRSIGLYYQMLGRGVRTALGKESCKVIDLTGTVRSIGRVETIKLVKNEKWELISETDSWHGKELYSFVQQSKQKTL